jgi:CelD/BcsL family acetyltransferase involved in cellulose biosynthesis
VKGDIAKLLGERYESAGTIPSAWRYRVELIGKDRLTDALLGEIDALAVSAAEPNVFYESWMLAPALAHLPVPELHLALVRDAEGALAGMFPFERCRYRGMPLWSLRSWGHDYVYLCTPLVMAGREQGVLGALLDWSASADAPCSILEFSKVGDDGPFAAALQHHAGRFALRSQKYHRALLETGDADPETGISGKHLKELRRLQRRLAENASLSYRALEQNEPAGPWIERFLQLEASGWKGREQTAIANHQDSRAFFVEAACRAHAGNRLQMLELVRDGQVVASKCNFLGGDGAFSFKIAYDEQYAKFSPGVLLELFNVRHLAETRSRVRWMDSCAKSNHPMINRVWQGRRGIASHSISCKGWLARGVVRYGGVIRRALTIIRGNRRQP